MVSADRYVRLEVPAHPALLRVARVAVASLAAELPFTLEDIEDVRIAVDELAAVAIEGCGDDATLALTMRVTDREVEVEGRVVGAGPPASLHPMAADLLDLVVPGYQVGVDGHDRTFRFAKQAQVHAS
jgi:anti-sigma regulatory factor (Ser/Thr protein kinase)